MENRVIPVLLYKNEGLYKGVKFKKYKYIGDALNAVRVFSEKEVDELILLDILATKEGRKPNIELIERIAEECYMPFSIGGGINSIKSIREILKAGAERIVLNTIATLNPGFVKEASDEFGKSTIIVSIDYKRNIWGSLIVYSHSGRKKTKYKLKDYALLMENMGAGELIINSIDREGTGSGLDLKTAKEIASTLHIPIIVSGGVGKLDHIRDATNNTGINAVAVGSFFVFNGTNRTVLISYQK